MSRLGCWLLLSMLVATRLSAAPPMLVEDVSRQPLHGTLAWCQEAPGQAEVTDPTQACDYRQNVLSQLPHGFSSDRHWLHLRLHNPTAQAVQRWLEVGHPRLQQVLLYARSSNADSAPWTITRTGLAVPAHQRPLRTQRLLLPIHVSANATAECYLRVSAQTHVNLRLTLWQLPAYFAQQSIHQIVQSLGMGGLMLAAVFTLLVYLQQRERAMLWLLASFVVEILLDASYTGLLAAYFWPPDQAYPIRLHGLLVGLTISFFILFVRDFLQSAQQYPLADRLLLVCLWLIGLALAATLVLGYASAIKLLTLTALVSMAINIVLFFRAWRQGSGPAGYLLLSYLLLLVMIIYRASHAFGWISGAPLQAFGYSWYFVLITPTTLLGILKRAETLRDSLIRAEADQRAHTRFLAQMSHELRSPLTTVINHARLLQRQPEPASIPARAEAILASSRRLLGLIDDVLDHARLQASQLRLDPEPLELAPFLAQLSEDHQPATDQAGNRLRVQADLDADCTLLADERRLRQVLDNLLSNANRYCYDGQITLACALLPPLGAAQRLSVQVSDTGPGIAPADQARIFLPFERGVHDRQHGRDGVGVGLAIARQLAQLMGGELQLSSRLGQGSTFSLTIPAPEVAPVVSTAWSWRQAPRPYRLLVVEDDPDERDTLVTLLRQHGFALLAADSASAARAYRDQPLDLVITDQFMAQGDGWQVLRDWGATHPVILLSAAPAQPPPDVSGLAGFAQVLLKPVDLDPLLDVIAAQLGFAWLSADR